MSVVAPERMGARLTAPFARGADVLALGFAAGATPQQATFAAYDFREHVARFDHSPAPRYTVTALADIREATRLTIGYVAAAGGPAKTTVIDVGPGTVAGASFAVSLGGDEGPAARLVSLASSPAVDAVDRVWRATALLGNMAKLLWVLGAARDELRGHLTQVRSQRTIARADGLTLDLFGYDLGVQRFPPQPHSWDEFAVALYHLDDLPAAGQPEVATVVNLIERYGGRPHPGTNTGARSGATGRFGAAFAFHDAAAITIPDDADFALAAGDSFTAECFASADSGAADGHVLAKHADPADGSKPGWALSVGSFGRGIERNVRFLVGDGTVTQALFLDASVDVARFYHLAGVIDRDTQQARLYVDGRPCATKPIAGLGALTNAEPVRIGNAAAAPFAGIVDEVRLSRVGRTSFHPVLGESDESYRTRLQIFERWTLPTPAGVRDALNRVAGPVGGDDAPFLVEDQDSPTATGALPLRSLPAAVVPGQPIAATGERGTPEADASGTTGDDTSFDPWVLEVHTGATYATPPARTLALGEPPPDPRKLQARAARTLDALVQLPDVGAALTVESAFDPRADDLRAVGRAVVLSHPVLAPVVLAARAHRAGFAWVDARADGAGVYASVPPGDYLELVITGGSPTTNTGFDVLVGEQLQLTAAPPPPSGVVVEWMTIACGSGRGAFPSGATAPVATLQPTAPGKLAVQLRVTRGAHVYSATRVLRVGIADLADGQTIGADHGLGIDEAEATRSERPWLGPTYLVTVADPRATYGNVLDNRRMQPALATRLARLLDLIAATGASGSLHVGKPSAPQAGSPEAIGLVLVLDHASLAPGRLGALCNAAGFTYVRRDAAKVRVVQAPEDPVSIVPVAPATTELEEGATGAYALSPHADPRAVALVGASAFVACGGTDAVSEFDTATGTVLSAHKVGWEPIALAAVGTSLFSLERSGRSVTRIDLAAGAVRESLGLAQPPVALVAHPSQGRLYVALANGDLVEIDTTVSPIAIARTVALAGTPVALAVTANGNQAWAALAEGRIAVVDTGTFAAPATVALPAAPADLAIGATTAYVTVPDGGRLVPVTVVTRAVGPVVVLGGTPGPVAVASTGAVFVLDTAAGTLLRRKANGDPDGSMRTGSVATDIVATGTRVYVVNRSLAVAPGTRGTADLVLVVDAARVDVIDGWQLGTGLGEPLTWTVSPIARGRLSSTTTARVDFTAQDAGPAVLGATYVIPATRATAPFTFAVRLKDALQADPNVVIRKDQYDLVMNVLNAFHPVGVEVATEAIRRKVIEVREGLIEVFPQFTYPDFRARGPDPRPAVPPMTSDDEKG